LCRRPGRDRARCVPAEIRASCQACPSL
jgi:hypothetical protein